MILDYIGKYYKNVGYCSYHVAQAGLPVVCSAFWSSGGLCHAATCTGNICEDFDGSKVTVTVGLCPSPSAASAGDPGEDT